MKDNAYKQAGVDIDAAAELVESIKPHAKKTARPGVMSGLGGFGALFDLKETGYRDPVLVSSTDGVGTKLRLAIDLDRHDTIGIDAVAMCVNDVIVQGAEPLFFLDYFATGKLQPSVAEKVIAGIAEGCRLSGCALIGGETAEMPGMYMAGDYDIAGFCVGAVERQRIITGETIREGDTILGLASNGLHSNGFSLVRHIIAKTQGYEYDSAVPFDDTLNLGELLLIPTRIYVSSILKALELSGKDGKPAIKGMSHITGGGLVENIPRIIPEGLSAHIDLASWPVPAIFRWLLDIGNLKPREMATTLNCGIGMAVVCAPENAERLSAALTEAGETVRTIGAVRARHPSGLAVILENLEESWVWR